MAVVVTVAEVVMIGVVVVSTMIAEMAFKEIVHLLNFIEKGDVFRDPVQSLRVSIIIESEI